MRAFERGKPFMDVEADCWDGDEEFKATEEVPVFTEAYLYSICPSKGDARFILAIAEEYDKIIEILGPKVERLLMAFVDDPEFRSVRLPGYICLNCGHERKVYGLDILRPCPKCSITFHEEDKLRKRS